MRVSAIIAAYNEEQSIADVLTVLQKSPLVDEILIVSDGSTDATVDIARQFDVRILALRENRGKGQAMRLGVDHAAHDVLFFVDGDMLDLTNEHIEALVRPVLERKCEMNVGVRHRGPLLDFFHLKLHFGPVLSGIRAMRRAVFETVPAMYQHRFKIELALNCFCARAGFRQWNTVIYDLGHVIKENKRGIRKGLSSRWDMSREVTLLHFDLYLVQSWRWAEPLDQPTSAYDLLE